MTDTPRFRDGILAAIPLILGYFPIAFSFGVAAIRAGLSPAEAVMFSVVIFAGAAQFLALALVTSGAPVLVSAATLAAMNLRHVMYGPALLEKAGKAASTRFSWAWGWCLTDEVFGASLGALARGQGFSEGFIGGLGLGAYLAWIAGTALGAATGGEALKAFPALDAGLGFMLPALFLALLLSILDRRQLGPVVVAIGATVLGSLVLSPTLGILAGIAAGAATGTLQKGRA
ncbi:4-azaleucine resistance transporter AzlC [Rhodobacter viridis]|uniref:4-azaleucine resistance transporter AzlC n=1 Tax=Rhodobacter viridis TaxID=1054202 RepID=A0A318TYQ2_9RHOB|nr:AzlC family ABC transporter permease [Rhodobacter viridis]PYF09957.1 4-azaleucine resistance transporter AzlC [Rhodobacter viridis]